MEIVRHGKIDITLLECAHEAQQGNRNILMMRIINKSFVILLVALLFSGCTHLGPQTVARDRFDYNTAIADSWKEQTLLNIVKVRYADMPLFVEVASIVSGYTLERSVNLGGQLSSADSIQKDSLSLGAAGKYTDRPTITYVPITGTHFNKSFMTPIPPSAILFLMQSGWPVDLIFPLTLDSINGHRSDIAAGANQRIGDSSYYRIIDLLRKIQKAGAMGMRIQKDKLTEETTVLFFHRKNLGPEIMAALDEVVELLNLRSGLQDVKISYGSVPETNDEMAMLTRSILQIMIDLASMVDVPPEHVAEGRTVPSLKRQRTQILKVHNSIEKPENALTAVKYKDHWFWIDDRDFRSKRTFTFLMILFSLTETGGREGLPLVTIPAS